MLPPRPLDTRLCDPSGSWLSTRDCFSRINDWKAILFMLACISSATDPPSRFKYIRVILVSANLTTSSAIRISERDNDGDISFKTQKKMACLLGQPDIDVILPMKWTPGQGANWKSFLRRHEIQDGLPTKSHCPQLPGSNYGVWSHVMKTCGIRCNKSDATNHTT